MARKKGGLEKSLASWAYQNKRAGSKASKVLQSVAEVEKTLGEIKEKKKKKT